MPLGHDRTAQGVHHLTGGLLYPRVPGLLGHQLDEMPQINIRWRHLAAKDTGIRLGITARAGDNLLVNGLHGKSKLVETRVVLSERVQVNGRQGDAPLQLAG